MSAFQHCPRLQEVDALRELRRPASTCEPWRQLTPLSHYLCTFDAVHCLGEVCRARARTLTNGAWITCTSRDFVKDDQLDEYIYS